MTAACYEGNWQCKAGKPKRRCRNFRSRRIDLVQSICRFLHVSYSTAKKSATSAASTISMMFLIIFIIIRYISFYSIPTSHSMVFLPARIGLHPTLLLRPLEGKAIPSAAASDDPVPGWLCALRSRAGSPFAPASPRHWVVATSVHFHVGTIPLSRPSFRSPQRPARSL